MLLYLLLFIGICIAGNCDNSQEIRSGVSINYSGSNVKTESRKQSALQILRWYQSWLNDFGNRQSFKAQHGEITGFLWSGSMLQNKGLATNGVQTFINEINAYGMPKEIYIEFLHDNALKSWGIILTANGLNSAQTAVKKWSYGQSYDKKEKSKSTGTISICYLDYNKRKPETNDGESGECFYNKLEENPKGNVGEYLKAFNPNLDFTKLQRGQPYCYSEGTLPNFKPSIRNDGTCAFYKVKSGDTCSGIGAQYTLTEKDINGYNKNTYGWKGCSLLQIDQSICLSEGKPQKPVSNPKAECGPLAPGNWDKPPECPNSACCSEFGFCGLTSEFCDNKKSETNAPGTTGCYSNCGVPDKLPNVKASSFKSTAYVMNNEEIYGYDIVHYAFANINNDFSINNIKFPKTDGKRVITLGGWEFSTNPSTYNIFREGVSDKNRDKFAHNIANFINNYDGVNFDWEYPEASDIPGIPAGVKGDGHRYYQLLKRVKELAPNKLVSIAIPASYWYLKGFPLKELNTVVDYFVLMNYDYVGQWDYGKDKTGIGCHVDRSLTEKSIKMIVKSGIDTTKVYGGLGNYGRAFELVNKNCRTYGCGFTGPTSNVQKGENTKTPGFLSIDEINKLNFWETKFDSNSKCFYGMWSDKFWVAWMHESDINYTEEWFKNDIGLGGSALWAYDYYGSENNNGDLDNEDLDYDYLDFINEDCSYNENADETNNDVTCYEENTVSYYIKKLENAKNNMVTLKNDKNYEDYYEAYIRAYYDAVMDRYEDWILKDNYANLMKYFTYQGKLNKREYRNDTETENSNITILLRPEISVVMKETNLVFVKTPKLEKFLNNTESISKRDGPGKISMEGNREPFTYVIDNSIIEDKDKDIAVEAINSGCNVTITKEALVTSVKDKEFAYKLKRGGIEQFKFRKSTIMNSRILVPDPLLNITSDIIESIEGAISKTKDAIGKEYILDIYDVLDKFLMFIDINDSAQKIYDEGKVQKKNYEKTKKLEILAIVLGMLGGLTLFLSPVEQVVADIAIVAINLITTNEITDGLTKEDIGLAIAGIFGGLLAAVRVDIEFIKLLKFINKNEGYKELKVFPSIAKGRRDIYGGGCI